MGHVTCQSITFVQNVCQYHVKFLLMCLACHLSIKSRRAKCMSLSCRFFYKGDRHVNCQSITYVKSACLDHHVSLFTIATEIAIVNLSQMWKCMPISPCKVFLLRWQTCLLSINHPCHYVKSAWLHRHEIFLPSWRATVNQSTMWKVHAYITM